MILQFLYSLTHPDIFGSSHSLKYFLFACCVLCTQVCRDTQRKVYAIFLISFLASTVFFIFYYNLLLSLIIVPHSLVMRILPSAPMSTPQHSGNRSCIHGETSMYFPFCIWFSAWDTICHLAAMLSVCSLIAKARWCSWGHTQPHRACTARSPDRSTSADFGVALHPCCVHRHILSWTEMKCALSQQI